MVAPYHHASVVTVIVALYHHASVVTVMVVLYHQDYVVTMMVAKYYTCVVSVMVITPTLVSLFCLCLDSDGCSLSPWLFRDSDECSRVA
jgi:hypothetical protein